MLTLVFFVSVHVTLWKKPASKAGCGSFTASERDWGSLYRYPEAFKPAGMRI